MKAISLWPPYASFIVAGLKRIETRSWKTSYRGPIAIHQTKGNYIVGSSGPISQKSTVQNTSRITQNILDSSDSSLYT